MSEYLFSPEAAELLQAIERGFETHQAVERFHELYKLEQDLAITRSINDDEKFIHCLPQDDGSYVIVYSLEWEEAVYRVWLESPGWPRADDALHTRLRVLPVTPSCHPDEPARQGDILAGGQPVVSRFVA